NAQDRITSLSLEEAVTLATRENFTLRAAQFDYQATRASEITGGLIPNSCLQILYQLQLAPGGSLVKGMTWIHVSRSFYYSLPPYVRPVEMAHLNLEDPPRSPRGKISL